MKADEPERLLAATETARDRVLLLTILLLGLRVSEACKLRIDEVDFHRREVWVRGGKGDRDRLLPMPRVLVSPLRGWIGNRKEGYVFPSPRGGRLTNRAVQKLFVRIGKKAGLRGAGEPRACNPHKFRHAYLSRLLESGATIHECQRLAGHASLQTTSVYLHCMNDDRLRDAVDRMYE